MTLPKEVREAALLHMKLAPWPLKNDTYADRDKYVGVIFDAALSALGEAGYAVVPVRPTLSMVRAGMDNNPTVFTKAEPGFARDVANDVYVAMVRAAMLSASQEGTK
ncbi:MAG TPA: hypothetical protein VM915_17315 [Verrucomicrobiae bacterium]|nr:hypothetical protein [Verrucomicrobiae bacterium]